MTDREFMERALMLARHGLGNVSPNPLVGAVLVKQDRVVGEGFHLYQQVKHAEVVACEQAGEEAAGATLYLNLEPCAHQGRTGPCCDYLIRKKIARVVAAMEDPHPLVSGQGFERLRQAGIRVEVGLMEKEAAKLNEAFAKFATCGLPFVTIKSAMSLDGKIAGCTRNQREYFSGPESAARVELLRLQVDAIAVGAETVLADDPLLTYRGGKARRRPLVRILLDPRGRVPLELRLFEDPSPVWWVRPPAPRLPPHVSLIESGADPESTWSRILKKMAEEAMYHLLIEGGGETNAGALRAGIVDKILWIYAPKLIGGKTVTSVIGGAGFNPAIALKDLSGSQVGQDFWIEAYVAK
ncbi:MAG: bifunctional diaminohydroxyphosphoribosylaminopyrimidine deaminase/5-amino-6-(5-phosphoribosylamino)uracil reductase RibD [Acidobacteria bacterium]|nr:bifunctional diaminohydroxyphosphoribosylaminopyrimidine deaminase/5-amino-6-(5-phosphoribosylamino)uracil reductase RibD [Acidobacteriota bacterium]